MTNREKYLKDGTNVIELAKDYISFVHSKVEFGEGYNSIDMISDFFASQPKPTLTEDEKVILRNIKQEIYKHIGRDDGGYLYIAQRNKNDFSSRGMNLAVYGVFGHLFQFIQPRRRI